MNKTAKLKLSQATQGFTLSLTGRHLSVHTVADYDVTLRKFKTFLERDYYIDDITAQHIEGFLAAQIGLSNKTLLNYHTGLSAFWTWALKFHYVSEHVVRQVQPPKPEEREIVPYSETEIRAMLASLERSRRYRRRGKRTSDHAIPYTDRNRAIILLLLDTGVRADELGAIKIHQVDRRNQRIYVFGKGAKERYVPFSDRTHQALWRYLVTRPEAAEGDPLFLTDVNRRFQRGRLLKMLKTIGRRAGVADVTVHRFRHTFAIQYLRNGGDPYTLQKILGHSSLEMVKRYVAIAQIDIERVHKRASPVGNWTL